MYGRCAGRIDVVDRRGEVVFHLCFSEIRGRFDEDLLQRTPDSAAALRDPRIRGKAFGLILTLTVPCGVATDSNARGCTALRFVEADPSVVVSRTEWRQFLRHPVPRSLKEYAGPAFFICAGISIASSAPARGAARWRSDHLGEQSSRLASMMLTQVDSAARTLRRSGPGRRSHVP